MDTIIYPQNTYGKKPTKYIFIMVLDLNQPRHGDCGSIVHDHRRPSVRVSNMQPHITMELKQPFIRLHHMNTMGRPPNTMGP